MKAISEAVVVMSQNVTIGEAMSISLSDWCRDHALQCVVLDPKAASAPASEGAPLTKTIVYYTGSEPPHSYLDAPAFKACRERNPKARVVVMSDRPTVSDCVASLENDVHGYLSTAEGLRFLALALDFILDGGSYCSTEILSQVDLTEHAAEERGEEPAEAEPHEKAAALTARQREVAVQLALGKSNKVIARTLGIQEATVKVHMRSIMQVLNARNRTEAALIIRRSLDVGHDGPQGLETVSRLPAQSAPPAPPGVPLRPDSPAVVAARGVPSEQPS
jgi:DNA-binding NarL/FixJ family response regulator